MISLLILKNCLQTPENFFGKKNTGFNRYPAIRPSRAAPARRHHLGFPNSKVVWGLRLQEEDWKRSFATNLLQQGL